MKKLVATRLLGLVREFLLNRYKISVLLVREDVISGQQVAEWRNNRLVIDIRNRGIQGSLCILCHVFGHLVQHSIMQDKYKSLLSVFDDREPPFIFDDDFKSKYFLFEKEAYQIGKGLLEQVTLIDADLECFYQAFMYVDFDHYWAYLLTGRETSRRAFNYQLYQLRQKLHTQPPEPLLSIGLPSALGDLSTKEILVV